MCEVGPVEFIVDLFFSELHFSTVVGEDSAWGAVVTGKVLFIPIDPPLFGLLDSRGIVPCPWVRNGAMPSMSQRVAGWPYLPQASHGPSYHRCGDWEVHDVGSGAERCIDCGGVAERVV